MLKSPDDFVKYFPCDLRGDIKYSFDIGIEDCKQFCEEVLCKVFKDSNAYPLVDYMHDLKETIFNNSSEDIYRRNLQRNYVESLITLLNAKPSAPNRFARTVEVSKNSDVNAIVRGTLNNIKENIASRTSPDLVNKYHYEDLAYRIQKALDPK